MLQDDPSVSLWESDFLPAWRACDAVGLAPLAKTIPRASGLMALYQQQSSPWKAARKQVEDACFSGVPARIRAKVWPALVGNKLRITADLFEVLRIKSDEVRFVPEGEEFDEVETICTEEEEEEEEEEQEKEKVERTELAVDVSLGKLGVEARDGTENTTPESGTATEKSWNEEDAEEESVGSTAVADELERANPRKQFIRKASVATQIEQDLSRTFPNLAFFHENGGPFRQSLQEILESYSLFRPGLGYVQGMSHIAAMLLLFMDRDPAFVCFCNILEDHVFFNILRDRDESIILRYMKLFEALLHDYSPKLALHFSDIGMRADMFIIDWLMTLLARALPLEVSARIWDCYLFLDSRDRKERFVWRCILSLLKLFSVPLEVLDFDSSISLLKNLPVFSCEIYFSIIRETTVSSRRLASLKRKVGIVP